MIVNIRQISQQLLNPCFNSPKEVVSWMGAIQGQDYAMGCRYSLKITHS